MTLCIALFLGGCGAASADHLADAPAQGADDITSLPIEQPMQPELPDKVYYPVIGAHVTTPDGYTAIADGGGVTFTKTGAIIKLYLTWEEDLAGIYQQMTEGYRRGDDLFKTNGSIEDLGGGRSGFVVVVGRTSSGEIIEFRYIATGTIDERGTLLGIAMITDEDEALMARAKQDLLQLLGAVNVVPATEAETLAAAAKARTEAKWRADMAAISTRKRTAEEQRFRQTLMGRALVKLNSESSHSSAGSAYFYSTERFQLCPNGVGTRSYSSQTSIQGMNTTNDGYRYETGNAYGKSKDHVHGEWDIEQHTGGMLLLIHTGDAAPSSWWITPNGNEGYIIGGVKFWIAGPDSEHGPQCGQ